MNVQGLIAKAVIESLVRALVVERLTQLSSNDRVFLDPGFKEALDPVDACQFGSEPFFTWYGHYI